MVMGNVRSPQSKMDELRMGTDEDMGGILGMRGYVFH